MQYVPSGAVGFLPGIRVGLYGIHHCVRDADRRGRVHTLFLASQACRRWINDCHKRRGTVNVTPALLRYALKFWPTYRIRPKNVTLKLSGFIDAWRLERDYLRRNISAFEQCRVLDPDPDAGLLADALQSVQRTFPGLAGLKQQASCGGCIDSTPDAVPVMDEISSVPRLFVESGFSGHGFGIGVVSNVPS